MEYIAQDVVDNAVVLVQHLAHEQQGYELRYRDGDNEQSTPQSLELDALLVDHQGDYHAEDVVQHGGHDGPDEGPLGQLGEGSALRGCAGGGEDAGEGSEPE